MNYVITGGAGHISKPLAETLIAAGHQVTVIGRNAANLAELTAKGAKAAVGSVDDVAFLTETFKGADGLYLMIPPNYAATDIKATITQVGKNYAAALQSSPVKHVVLLSSIGAHLTSGTGPIVGLHNTEEALKALPNINFLFLRPAFFYYNFLGLTGLVKHANIIGNNFSFAAGKFPIVDTSDIAAVAADALLKLSFTGHTVQYIASDIVGTDQIAAAIGKAVGKPELPWVKFADADTKAALLQAGLGESGADNLVEMGAAFDSGAGAEDFWKHQPTLGKVKIDDFAKTFAAVYNAQ